MGAITTMTVFVWTLNVLIFMSQIAMITINPDSNVFYSTDNTVFQEYTVGGNVTMPNSTMIETELSVADTGEISPTGTGIFFVDAIMGIKQWIKNKINYFVAIVMGPYNILNAIDILPKQYVGLVSFLWYGVSILLIILTILGRNT